MVWKQARNPGVSRGEEQERQGTLLPPYFPSVRFSHSLRQVIEYTLFQPGWFLNYIAGERKTAKYIDPAPLLLVDHANRRARVAGDLANKLSYTLVSDVANIVAKAIDYEGEWPTVGGINGQTLSIAEEIALGEKVRGKWNCGTIRVDNAHSF